MRRRIILAICFLIGHTPERINESGERSRYTGEPTRYDLRCSRCGGKVRE
jgi:hypothetical protein